MGDNADMAMIEFVDFNDLYTQSDSTKKSTRRGRSKSKSKEDKILDSETKISEVNPKKETKDSVSEKDDEKSPEKKNTKASEKEVEKTPKKEDQKSPKKED